MNTPHPNKKKKFSFYSPGLFSLIFLLPLFIFWMYKHGIFEKKMVLEVTWHDAKDTSMCAMPFPPYRKFTAVQLTGEKSNDNRGLSLTQTLVKNIMNARDTVTGVSVHFHNTSTYESFVQVLNICNREGIRHVAHENDVFIFNHYDKLTIACGNFRLGCCTCGTWYQAPPEDPHPIIAAGNVIWPSSVLYFMLVVLVIVRLFKSTHRP
jgi:hypothetical protein